jgi:hypothetical protein
MVRAIGGPLSRILSVTSPAPREAWEAVLRASPQALAFHTPAWLDSICAVGGYADASRLYELRGRRRVVLPLIQRRGLVGALPIAASLPYGWGFGGAVAEGELRAEDAASILMELAHHMALRTSLRPSPLVAPLWTAAAAPTRVAGVPRLAHVLDLEGGFERVWTGRFAGRARRSARRAARDGVVVECDSTGRLVPVFHDLYRRSVDRWAQQAGQPLRLARWRAQRNEPLRKYQVIAARMREACRVYVAWVDGRPAAACVVLYHGANASYWRGAIDKDLAGPSQANFLLHSRSIEDACVTGCRYYHMGESGDSASLAHFKEAFGAEPYRYAEYYLERLPVTPLARWVQQLATRVTWGGLKRADAACAKQATSVE